MPKKTKSKPSTRRKSSSKNSSRNSSNNALSNLDMTDALLIIIVILVVYYLLMNKRNGNNNNNNTNNNNTNTNNNNNEGYANNNSKPTMMLFHAKWCGHCVRFMPEWKKFKNQAKINVVEYEADEDSDKMSANNVKGYPTIKCRTSSGDIKEFDGERTVAGLNAFAKKCSK